MTKSSLLSYDKNPACVHNIKISRESEIIVLYTHFMKNSKNVWNYEPHSHSFYELHAVASGSCTTDFEDGSASIAANEFIVIPPGKKHSFKKCSDDFFRFSAAFNLTGGDAPSGAFPLNEKCAFYVNNLLAEYEAGQAGYKNIINASITSFLIEALRICKAISNENGQPQVSLPISRALRFIDNNISHKIDAEATAAEAFVSVRHLNRIFKDKLGMSVTEYIKVRKINDAKEYLKKTDFSVKEIASLTGCSDEAYFCKLFKKKTGYSPKKYRNFGE